VSLRCTKRQKFQLVIVATIAVNTLQLPKLAAYAMFVETKVSYSTLLTNLVRCHVGTVSFPLSDIILAQIACPLSDVMFCLDLGITNLSFYKHWAYARTNKLLI
jgi:hypothetical protein